MADKMVAQNIFATQSGLPPKKQNQALQNFAAPHIQSFNYMLEDGLSMAVKDIMPQEFLLPDGKRMSLHLVDASIGIPTVPEGCYARTMKIYPSECRERAVSYGAKLQVSCNYTINGGESSGFVMQTIADVPIMVKSKNCSLHNLSPAELVQKHEEAEPLAMIRPSWKGRGQLFTEFGVSVRTVKEDQSGTTNVLHYLTDQSCILSFLYKKQQFFVPLIFILKALVNTTDYFIYKELIKGFEKDAGFKDAVSSMLREAQNEQLTSQNSVLKYIGEKFRVKVNLPPWYSDEEVGSFLIRNCVLIHLNDGMDKFNFLVFMTQKLYDLVNDRCAPESPDNPMNQELLLGGHLYLMVLKEKLEVWFNSVRLFIERTAKQKGGLLQINNSFIERAFGKAQNVGKQMEYFLATGNLLSRTGLGLMQTAGFAVVADKLNFMRYLSHFRCVHRGAFFSQMRTTSVRKLLPEAWGFFCPVHTPDGAPCGLLNHLTASCEVVNTPIPKAHLKKLLISLGMVPTGMPFPAKHSSSYVVMLDGKVVGRVVKDEAQDFVDKLRYLKATEKEKVSRWLEAVLVPRTKFASQYPGIFIFTNIARMMRPVKNLRTGSVEYIGSFEQVYMDIAVCPNEAHEKTTHLELKATSMLSALASMTPFSDYNQSPRNMYQCQMGKQTMGTPCQALKYRSDNKLYRIQTPQSPLVKNETYDEYGTDNFPLGINAVVAVISYTGYDMEDAMIINKASLERGFASGSIYKCETINLASVSDERGTCSLRFGCKEDDPNVEAGFLDVDGLPPVGRYVEHDQPYYCYYDLNTGAYKTKKFSNLEPAYVDDVKILGNARGDGELNKVAIRLRIERNPIIGDKFSSRHGQKGILSMKWPMEDMPFTESGMQPDILFNPHGFPSRMTIGMLIESMAGKSASLHGITHDSTPFKFSEEKTAIDFFGNLLTKAGYNYFGNERLYSGTDGRELEADIFVGIVYYQRLRHMVADKFQVRTTGPIDQLTHQPVGGRKRQGGIRFGEMERDALISHGSAMLLHDRLMNCSDETTAHICTKCGSLLSPILDKPPNELAAVSSQEKRRWSCLQCKSTNSIKELTIPYVFRYLVAELATMNINVIVDVR
eukprot:gene14271-5300_t